MACGGRVSVMEADLNNLYYADEPEEQPLPRKKVPSGDVYEAARAGDVDRLKILLEQGVNVNSRDSWDSAALYYACLAGHLDAARMLMESGAICSQHTFDGDRCHYAALNLRVRKLLKAFEARPPPLQPLPKSLRELFLSSKTNLQYFEGNSEACEQYAQLYGNNFSPDVTFYVNRQPIEAHRVILGARSPYFKNRFERDWKHRKEIRFANWKLTFSALFSLIHFFYTDRLDVAVDDMEDLARICKVCRCFGLQKAVEKELVHQKFAEYKHLRDTEDSQKRFILQGSCLPEKERLPASLHRLLSLSLRRSKRELGFIKANPNGNDDRSNFETEKNREVSLHENLDFLNKESMYLLNGKLERPAIHRTMIRTLENTEEHINGNIALPNLEGTLRNITGTDSPSNIYHAEVSDDDHADVCFSVQGQYFRSHQVIMAARSEYFRMRFSRISGFLESSSGAFNTNNSSIPVLKEDDLSAEIFEKLLEYMYTDQVTEVALDQAEEMFDAASRYLLFPLKRVIADALLLQLEMVTPADLCHWLQVADMYGVSKLREYCLDAIAANFETFAATREFRRILCVFPPPSGDSSARTSAPNAPGDEGRSNDGNLLDDLREKWLEAEGAELDKRDESARLFDKRLELLVLAAENDEIENDEGF